MMWITVLMFSFLLFLNVSYASIEEKTHDEGSSEQDCGCDKLSSNRNLIINKESQSCLVSEKDENSLCDESAARRYVEERHVTVAKTRREKVERRMVLIKGGEFQMGNDEPPFEADGEHPARNVTVDDFSMDVHVVSNSDFANFVQETNHVSEAEKFGNSRVLDFIISEEVKAATAEDLDSQVPWWLQVEGADWKHPEGLDSNITDRMDHPVVHVSWNDAVAYCEWEQKRLPTEAEWEYACRSGLKDRLFPWGDELTPNDKQHANIWQGMFPKENTAEDGYIGTAPVSSFPETKFGLKNMVGNVWEWTNDSWTTDHSTNTTHNPVSSFPETKFGLNFLDWIKDSWTTDHFTDASHNPFTEYETENHKVRKGGSYACAKNFCYRYRCSARTLSEYDGTAGNLGFRCVSSSQAKKIITG